MSLSTIQRGIDEGRPYHCRLDYETLYNKYWNEEKSQETIGNELGYSPSAIWRRMKKLKVPTRSSGNCLGRKHTEEELDKMSDSMKTWYKKNPEWNKGENNGFYGEAHTNESKEKVRQSKIGKPAWNIGLTKDTNMSVKIMERLQ